MEEHMGHRIIRLRKAMGLNQKQAAAKIGATPCQMSDYEKGARKPSIETLEWICAFFGVTATELLGF